MENKVPPVPDKKLILHRRVEQVVLAVAGGATVTFAVAITAAVATDPQRDAAAVVLVAVFTVMATLAAVAAVSGIGECRNDIRRARR